MNKKDTNLLLLEIEVCQIKDDPAKLKRTCRTIYNKIKNKPFLDIYDVMSAMSYGHVGGIKKMPEVEKAMSARKRTNNWSKIIRNMACDMLFHTINENRKKTLSIMCRVERMHKKRTASHLEKTKSDYRLGELLTLMSIYCMCVSIEHIGTPKSKEMINNAVECAGKVWDMKLMPCIHVVKLVIDDA